ncbi:MAG: fructose-6-phosphate aldolase [Holosporaceae bacterium]|jgi:transaldolase|nr:fructose-6-phosphate aldolase [Holosporaceae bacterium]
MEIFLDGADLDDIVRHKDLIDGVTTNPSVLSRHKSSEHRSIIEEICSIVTGPVSMEVNSEKYADMLEEGRRISKIHSSICVKLPCTFDGFRCCRALSVDGVPTNLTLCFSAAQAMLAAKCGATYVSPFLGRLDDAGHSGLSMLEEIVEIFSVQDYETKVLAASVRNLQHVIGAAIIGADAITMPATVLKQCFDHPLTAAGLEIFARDYSLCDTSQTRH